MAILAIGEKVHIIERRLFPEDVRRHFVGEVVACTENAFRVKGYPWIFDGAKGFFRRPEMRERVVSLSDRVMINVLPPEAKVDKVKYVIEPGKGIVVTDEKTFRLEISEFAPKK